MIMKMQYATSLKPETGYRSNLLYKIIIENDVHRISFSHFVWHCCKAAEEIKENYTNELRSFSDVSIDVAWIFL